MDTKWIFNEIEIIDDREYFCLNRKHLKIESGYKNWAQIFEKCDPEKQTCRHELIPNTKFQPYRVFAQSHLALMKQNGFLMPPHPLTNFEIQKYYQNKPRFNGVSSVDNFSKKIKDRAYAINLDENPDVGTHWIALSCK